MSHKTRNPTIRKRMVGRPVPKAPARPLPPSKPPPPNTRTTGNKRQFNITPKRSIAKSKRNPSSSTNYTNSPSSHYIQSPSNASSTKSKRAMNIIPPLSTANDDDHDYDNTIDATVHSLDDYEDDEEEVSASASRSYIHSQPISKRRHKGTIEIHENSSLDEIDEEYDIQYDEDEEEDEEEEEEAETVLDLYPLQLIETVTSGSSAASPISLSSTDKNDHFRQQMIKHNMSPTKSHQQLRNMKKKISSKRHMVTHSMFNASTPTEPHSPFGVCSESPSFPQHMSSPPFTHHQRVGSLPPVKPLPTLPSHNNDNNNDNNNHSTMHMVKPLTLNGMRSKSANAYENGGSGNKIYSKTPQPNLNESVLEVAVPPKVHNMLQQSHSPITPAVNENEYKDIEFEFNPKHPRSQRIKNNNNHRYKSPRNSGNNNNRKNQTMFIQPMAKSNRHLLKGNNIKIKAKHVSSSSFLDKSLTPTPMRHSSNPFINEKKGRENNQKKKKASIKYKITAKKKTKPNAKTRSDERVVKKEDLSSYSSDTESGSDSPSSSSSASSSSSSSDHGGTGSHVKGKQSQFVIKNMRYAQSRSPRFAGGALRRRNKKRSSKRVRNGTVTMPKKLGIIKANKKEKSAFDFEHRKRGVTTPRSFMQSAMAMSQSARVLTDNKQDGKDGKLTYADYKRIRKKEEEKRQRAETGSSMEWICGDQIGKGAFGTVYKGYVIATGKLIAIKEFKYTFRNKKVTLRLFEKETQIMKQLKHANIVEFFDYKLVEQKIYLIMEYVPGNSIESIYIKRGTFSENTIQKYVYQLICGLDYAHSRNIIHRDIKGKNILIDNKGIVKIADFGSAILTEKDNHSKHNAYTMDFESTPLWTAPEVLTDGRYDLKIDIWSTGCVIIEMATAQRPWNEVNFQSPFQALYHIGNTEAIPAWPNSLSVQCQAFIAKCLIRDPTKRYDTRHLLQHPFLKRKQ